MNFKKINDIDDVALNILRQRYFREGETTWEQVAKRVVDWVMPPEYPEQKEEVLEMISNRYMIPNSPCLVNAGTPNSGLSACFVVDFKDTIEDIYKTKLDFALIARKGGGCGTTLSKIRPEGSMVNGSTHGYAGGPIKFANTISHDMEALTQAGFRDMAIMFSMSARHPDIKKFITAKQEEGVFTNANISVIVDDDFMESVKKDDSYWTEFNGKKYECVLAREIFDMIVEGAWKNGEPGIQFYERMNSGPYFETGQEILNTNPCLHPDTMIETVNGRVPIKDIKEPTYVYTVGEDGKLTIKKASASWVSKRGAKTIKLMLRNNKELIVTPEHKICSRKRGWVEAKDLYVGEEIVTLDRARRGTRYSGIKLSIEPNRDYRMEHRFIYEGLNWQIDKSPAELRSKFLGKPRIVSIEEGPVVDVYDIEVEDTHNLIANYIVVHNCGEIPAPPNGVCNLASIDVSKFVDEGGNTNWELLGQATILTTIFLDWAIDKNGYPTSDIFHWALANRPIGIGIMGLADYYIKKKMVYGSPESVKELEALMSWIWSFANGESVRRGCNLGIPSECMKLKSKRRNITLLTVAPTGSISLIAGCSSGIEPIFSEVTVRQDKTGTYYMQHPMAGEPYFRCAVSANGATEVTWKEHLDILAAAQKYVDSGVSKTINFPQMTRKETIANAFMYAWETKIIKGVTVYRNGSRNQEVLSPKNLKKDKCPVCGHDLIFESGCKKCENIDCGWSVCTVG
jgi:ribonucleoside-diphosphate reductase alpha chain